MTPLLSLVFPIFLSSVVVFIVSTIVHMVLPWHKSDYPKMPNEEKVSDALRPFAIPPGDYFIPRVESRNDLNSPEFNNKLNKGPVILMTVFPNGRTKMGPTMFYWFLFLLIVGIFSAYVTGSALGPGAAFWQVFRFAGTTAFIGYCLALWEMFIWYKRSFSITIKATIDGLIFACFTAAVFGWLWPS